MTRPYYGSAVLLVAAAAMVGTLPGRTQGLGPITEPPLTDLGDFVSWARINFWATLIGAVFAVGFGRVVDRLLSRAMGIYAAVMSMGFMIAFAIVGAVVQARGLAAVFVCMPSPEDAPRRIASTEQLSSRAAFT